VRCALNHEGRCLAYEQRPLGCRNAHALDTDAHCGSNDRTGQPAVAVSFAPLDDLMVGSARLLRAVHNQMEHVERHRAEALCQAVARLIGLD
jgi:hypothetical protein